MHLLFQQCVQGVPLGSVSGGNGVLGTHAAQGKLKATGYIPGVLLCAAIALPSFELSHYSPSLDALALSLIIGVILRNTLGLSASVQAGVGLASAVFIPCGMILYGTRLDFRIFTSMPAYTLLLVLFSVALFYLTIPALGRLLNINSTTSLLVASGSAICGASAIAVLSPVVRARSRDTSIALIVTTAAGLTGALLYPAIADSLSLNSQLYGIFCGSTLQQTGIVRLAASHLGPEALSYAVPVKMLRIAMLAPAAVVLAGFTSMEAGRDGAVNLKRAVLRAIKRAWFVPVFLAVALVFSFAGPAADMREIFNPISTIALSLALASIGLTVDLGSIRTLGSRPLALAFAGWALVGMLVLAALLEAVR
jgi:uncharacterized integral membrane protein (TIGR00698 family)